MNMTESGNNISLLQAVVGNTDYELEQARKALTNTIWCEKVFLRCGEETLSTFEGILRRAKPSIVIFTAPGGGEAVAQVLRLAKAVKEKGILSLFAAESKTWDAAEFLAEHHLDLETILHHADSLILVPEEQRGEDSLYSHVGDFFSLIRRLLKDEGFINLELLDIYDVLKNSRLAYIATCAVEGCGYDERVHKLKMQEIFPERICVTAKRSLAGVVCCEESGLEEVDAVAMQIQNHLDPNALLIFGAAFDDELECETQVMVLISESDV